MTKKTGILLTVLLLLVGLSGAVPFKQKIAFIEKIIFKDKLVTIQEGTTRQLHFEVRPAKHAEHLMAVSSDKSVATVTDAGLVTAIKPGKAKITLMGDISGVSASIEVTITEKGSGTSGNNPVPNKPVYSKGKANLGYGVYNGELKNGQPHGYGTLTYTEAHQIVPSKDYIAQPGDTFEGNFRDGKIAGGMGYWRHDGKVTPIMP